MVRVQYAKETYITFTEIDFCSFPARGHISRIKRDIFPIKVNSDNTRPTRIFKEKLLEKTWASARTIGTPAVIIIINASICEYLPDVRSFELFDFL